MRFELKDDETIEDLQLGGLRLIQKRNGFRFGMDTVLLAHFARIRPNDAVADLGTGNGILPLLLTGRKKGRRYYAFEMMREAAELAQRNAELNGLGEVITVFNSDAEKAPEYIGTCTMDAVVCNPPYGQPAASLASPNAGKAAARNQTEHTLDKMFRGAFMILKGRGSLFLVYPASQMLHVMKKLQECHLEPKRFRMVYPYPDKAANLVLIEAVKDARPTLHPMPPLIIYEKGGSLTNELKSVYHMKEQTEFYY